MSKHERHEQQKIASELQDLLGQDIFEADSTADVLPDMNRIRDEYENEISTTKEKIWKQARRTVINIARLYLADDALKKYPHVKTKMRIDCDSLGEILYRMYSVEAANHQMLVNMQLDGNSRASTFDAFTNMNKLGLEISVQKSQFLIALEESYKKLKLDIDYYDTLQGNDNKLSSGESTQEVELDSGITIRGLRKINEQARLLNSEVGEFKQPKMEPKDPTVYVETGNDIPDEIKFPMEKTDEIRKIKEEVEGLESYFSEEGGWE